MYVTIGTFFDFQNSSDWGYFNFSIAVLFEFLFSFPFLGRIFNSNTLQGCVPFLILLNELKDCLSFPEKRVNF